MTDLSNLTPSERELMRLAEAATEGPWHREGFGGAEIVGPDDQGVCCTYKVDGEKPFSPTCPGGEKTEANPAFIAASRTAIPALLAEVARLRGALADLAMMQRRMIWQAEKQTGDTSMKALAGNARQLLAKYQLNGIVLRDDEARAALSPQAGGGEG